MLYRITEIIEKEYQGKIKYIAILENQEDNTLIKDVYLPAKYEVDKCIEGYIKENEWQGKMYKFFNVPKEKGDITGTKKNYANTGSRLTQEQYLRMEAAKVCLIPFGSLIPGLDKMTFEDVCAYVIKYVKGA
jgi:hypothetical protein